MDVLDAIVSRVSITRYTDEGVEREQIARVLEAGRWAPSAGNMQVAEFIVVSDEDKLEKISQYAHNQPHIREAPVALVICIDEEKAERQYGDRGSEVYAVQESGAAMQNMMLTAYDDGLGAAWVGAFDEEQVAGLLRIPERVRPMAIVTLGHPAEQPEQPDKYGIQHRAFINEYGNRVHPIYEKIVWRGLRHYADKAKEKIDSITPG